LSEYEYLFPKNNSEMKGIKGYLRDMKIELNHDTNPFKQRPYRLNPRLKEKVNKEIDRMLVVGLIFPMDEDEWISPIIIQINKGINDITVCVDYGSLNSSYVQDPFATPFSDEFLDHVVGNKAYSFIYGFFGYHQVMIAEEYKKKTTFTINSVSFS